MIHPWVRMYRKIKRINNEDRFLDEGIRHYFSRTRWAMDWHGNLRGWVRQPEAATTDMKIAAGRKGVPVALPAPTGVDCGPDDKRRPIKSGKPD